MAEKKSPIIAGIACRSKEDRENILSVLRTATAKKMRLTSNLKLTRFEVALEALTKLNDSLDTELETRTA